MRKLPSYKETPRVAYSKERDILIRRLYAEQDWTLAELSRKFGLHSKSIRRIIDNDRSQRVYNTSNPIDAKKHPIKEHGTPAGARAHYRRGEKPCDDCNTAAQKDHKRSDARVKLRKLETG